MQTNEPCVVDGARPDAVVVEVVTREGVGCRSGQAGPNGQWPSPYALQTGTSLARPKPKLLRRKGVKAKSSYAGSRVGSADSTRLAALWTSAVMLALQR